MKRFKLIVPVCLTFMALSTVPTPITTTELLPLSMNTPEDIAPLAESTEWVYRMHNGVLQMRLWSNLTGTWLTDWIDCE